MTGAQRKRLEAAGWKFESAAEFLNLSPAEAALVEMKLALARGVKRFRLYFGVSQDRVAKFTHSSQSRVAKMEKADPSVSFELYVQVLLKLGAGRDEIARILTVQKPDDVEELEIHPKLPAAERRRLLQMSIPAQ